MNNVIKPLAKSVLIPLGKTAESAAADAVIHKKILGSANRPSSSNSDNNNNNNNTILIISNYEMKDFIKIVKYLENSSLLREGVSKTI